MARKPPRAAPAAATSARVAAASSRAGRPSRRRLALVVAGLALLALAALGVQRWLAARPTEVRREAGLDVLLVTIDTLRADALGVYGQKRPTSPWIDKLARAGVRFETAYAHNVVTLPSHANILTGRLPFEHGVRENSGFRVPPQLETLATLLKARGYATAAFVSGFPLDSRFGLGRGFDLYDDAFADAAGSAGPLVLPERAAADTGARARRWLAQPASSPRFTWVHFYDPHTPYRPLAPFAAAFVDAPYLGEVAAADATLGTLVQPLLDAGRAGRTLVIVTADHGESLGEHGERTHGLFAYEATLRVPLLLFAPRLLRPRVVKTPARHIDLLPTVLDALALPLPAGLPGRSLLGPATGHETAGAPSYFEALSAMLGRGWAPLYGVVSQGRKYVDLPLPELYDLERDPHELANVAATQARPREALLGLLRDFRAADRGIERAPESAETRARLAALGYVSAASAPRDKRYTKDDDPKRLVQLDDLMQQAIARHREGDLEGAAALCREVVRRRPDMTAALLQLALVLRKLGQLPPAIVALEDALAANPDDPSTVVLLGSYLAEAGRAREAAALLATYARRDDPPLDVLTTLGVAYARLGRGREALQTFEHARRLDPSSAMILVQMATVDLGARAFDDARGRLEEALRLSPRLALAHHHLALVARAQGRSDEAERLFRSALELDGADPDSLLNLGLLLAARGRGDEAAPYLEAFLNLAPAAVYAPQIAQVEAWLGRRVPQSE